jgi:hypothetical protein
MTRSPAAVPFLINAALITAIAATLAGIATFIAADFYKARSPSPVIERMAAR